MFALKLNFVMNRSVLSESNLIFPSTTLALAFSTKNRKQTIKHKNDDVANRISVGPSLGRVFSAGISAFPGDVCGCSWTSSNSDGTSPTSTQPGWMTTLQKDPAVRRVREARCSLPSAPPSMPARAPSWPSSYGEIKRGWSIVLSM